MVNSCFKASLFYPFIVSGDDIDSTTSIPLKKLIVKAMKNVPDPTNPTDYERTYYDLWKENRERDSFYNRVCGDNFCSSQKNNKHFF